MPKATFFPLEWHLNSRIPITGKQVLVYHLFLGKLCGGHLETCTFRGSSSFRIIMDISYVI